MILVWNDAQSFKQHLEDMTMFRRSHHGNPGARLKLLRDMPIPHDIHPSSKTGGISGFIKTGGKTIIVPIWKIELPRCSQN